MIRIGVDFGGTKIEAAALDAGGAIVARLRRPNPGAYEPALSVVAKLVAAVEAEAGGRAARIGVGMPGSISPTTGLIRNANSVWLNGERFGQDLEAALARPVRLANDANCLALSEAADGAGAGAGVVFAAILGTGCGGGVVVDGRLLEGRNGVAGEWGHTPLPWPTAQEHPGPACWCGRRGCLETWISGPALAADHGTGLVAPEIIAQARQGAPGALASLQRYVDRLGRALAVVADLIDPDVIVLGGGMSNVAELYEQLPAAIAPHVFADGFDTPVRAAVHGDSSGVRGAAWLWPPEAP
ncbi:ROK family protein [Phenylobacterium sp.]|uniref:ROK family protein n=1 Tax=Phenylobacterium sp. TaxID=1871053 RepID=UPI00272FDED6|nr:ROK family protein [Phenylobacterium sp.]MDP2213636.1 ROK family protein [Phenylobacterium sp.]